MSFKHKLSRRLATLWPPTTVAFLATMLACEPGQQPVAPGSTSTDTTASSSIPNQATTGGTVLLQETFEDAAFASRGWYDNTAMATTTAQYAPGGSTRSLEVHFPAGATTPTWGGAARHLFTATPTLYVSYWVKYSDNWVGSGRAYHPHEFLILSDQDGDWDGPADNWLTGYIEQNYQNGGIPRLALQDNKAINTSYGAPPINLTAVTEDRSVSGCNGVVESGVTATCFNMPPWYNDKEINSPQVAFQPTAGPGYKGNWNHVEVYLQVNSIVNGKGAADGVMQYWFNGTLLIDRHDILFRTGARPSIQFHQFMIAPYMGDGSPVDQTMWVDDLTLATARTAPTSDTTSTRPAKVTDLSVTGVTDSSATLRFTEVNDGAGAPAKYLVRYAPGTISWGAATDVTKGTCKVPLAGTSIGAKRTCTVQGLSASTGYQFQLVAFRGTLNVDAVFGPLSNVASKTTKAKAVTNPGTVTDLAVTGATSSSLTLSFTEVSDGAGKPASYDVRFAKGTISWGAATEVTQGTCKVPLAGTSIGAKRSCTVQGLAASTAYQFQMIAFRGTLNVDAVFGGLSNVAGGTTTADPVAPVASVTVSPSSASLLVGGTQQYTATLKDASGNILTGRSVTWSSNAPLVASVSSGGLATGLLAGVASITATSEGQSGSTPLTVTALSSGGGGVVFQSDWSTASGLTSAAITDAGRWMNYWEFNNNTSVQLLSVVAGFGPPGYANALKVLQRGETYAANLQQDNVVPPSTDFYVRFYMRNDDTSSPGDHVVTVDTWKYANLTFVRKSSSASGWRFVSSFYGCGFTYPIGHWGPNVTLSHNAWYRFEYFVHFVDPTHVQVHPRVYDASGTQILGDADFLQEDYGSSGDWNGSQTWTLASYYAAGYSFCVDPTALTSFGLGNNGQAGAVDTGLSWYFAGIQIRTDRWPGP